MTRRMWHLFLLSVTICASVNALHESDVGIIDWHKRFIGGPNPRAPFTLPAFHRVRDEAAKTTASVVIVGTKSNVLSGLDPITGEITWRHLFSPSDPILSFQTHPKEDLVASHSGPGGANLRVFSALKGQLICETRLHPSEEGRLEEPPWLGSAVVFSPEADSLYVLSNGNTVTKLNAECEPVWTWVSPNESYSVFFVQILVSNDAIYVVGMTSSTASYTLHLTTISPADGTTLENRGIPSSVFHPTGFFLLTSPTLSSSPQTSHNALVWLEESRLKYLPLSPSLKSIKASTVSGAFSSIQSLGQVYNGYFIAQKVDGTTHALQLQAEDGKIRDLWEFTGSGSDPTSSSPSMFNAGFDKAGKIYISRTYWSYALGMGSMNVYSESADGRGMVTGLTFPYRPAENGVMLHVALDVSNPNPLNVRPRFVISTSLSSFQLWDRDHLQWTRDEGLTEIADAAVQFVDLPERKKDIDITHETFVEKVWRQLGDAKNFPVYLSHFIRRFATGAYDVPLPLIESVKGAQSPVELFRDAFGFRKLVLVASANGKLYALDSSTGNVVYSCVLSFGGVQGASFRIVKLFVTRSVVDAPGSEPQATLIVTRINPEGSSTTLLYTFEALTGKSLRGGANDNALEGVDLFEGITQDAYLMQFEKGKLVVIVDGRNKVYLHPNNALTRETFSATASKLHIPLLSTDPTNRRLTGYQIYETEASFMLSPTWTLSLPPAHRVQSIFKPPIHQPIASYGKVLANRTTLYKYLNSHLIGVISTAAAPIEPRCTLQLLDSVTGHVVYQVDIPVAPYAECNVKATLTENWLVYHYWEPETSTLDSAKGWRMVSVEFYEGSGPDRRLRSSELSSFALQNMPVKIHEQSFVFPRGITAISTTSTANGITVKDIIVANQNNQIQTFPRRFLDPRRSKTKPSAQEQEQEWLMQYDPVLPDDTRRVISHTYDVASIRAIHTTSTNLESTSLVFAHGLDLFFTRVSPSGTFDLLSESFNKVQLVLTIGGLSAAIFITRPMVRRKKLREKWYY